MNLCKVFTFNVDSPYFRVTNPFPMKRHTKPTFAGSFVQAGGLMMILLAMSCSEKKPAQSEGAVSAQSQFQHPLNPLSMEEIKEVKQILVGERKMDTTFRFHVINLNE